MAIVTANVIDFLAALIQVGSGSIKKKSKILVVQIVQLLMQAVSMLLLGGVTGAVCEAACGYAALTVLPEGQSLIGVEYKINFLRGITTDKVIAKAAVIKKGRRLLVIEADAFNEGSNKIAAKILMTGTPVES